MSSITAKELAAMLHLSESAISLALNNKPGVSRETRKRVMEAAKKQGYDFSRKAVAREQKMGTICFAVYRKSGAVVGDTPFFSELTEGISSRCRREGYECVIRYLYEDEDHSLAKKRPMCCRIMHHKSRHAYSGNSCKKRVKK